MLLMTRPPLVSIIVPIYNMERFLDETLKSIVATTYRPLEVVLVNDGSKDKSRAIAQEYANSYDFIRLVDQENAGVSRARNHGIDEAKGEYILPVDADNLIEPSFVGHAVDAFLQGDTNLRVVRPRMECFGEKSGEWVFPPFSLKLLALRNILDNCAMFRKSDWQRVGGYCETLRTREDWDFWLSMLEHGGTVQTLPDVGLHYRLRSDAKHKQHSLHRSNVIPMINLRHPELMEMAHRGPLLKKHRQYSRLVNRLRHCFAPRHTVMAKGQEYLIYFVRALPVTLNAPRTHQIADSQYEVTYAGKTYLVTVFDEHRLWPLASCAAQCSKQPMPEGHALVGYLETFRPLFWMYKSYLVIHKPSPTL